MIVYKYNKGTLKDAYIKTVSSLDVVFLNSILCQLVLSLFAKVKLFAFVLRLVLCISFLFLTTFNHTRIHDSFLY